jgi:hypothetical protein
MGSRLASQQVVWVSKAARALLESTRLPLVPPGLTRVPTDALVSGMPWIAPEAGDCRSLRDLAVCFAAPPLLARYAEKPVILVGLLGRILDLMGEDVKRPRLLGGVPLSQLEDFTGRWFAGALIARLRLQLADEQVPTDEHERTGSDEEARRDPLDWLTECITTGTESSLELVQELTVWKIQSPELFSPDDMTLVQKTLEYNIRSASYCFGMPTTGSHDLEGLSAFDELEQLEELSIQWAVDLVACLTSLDLDPTVTGHPARLAERYLTLQMESALPRLQAAGAISGSPEWQRAERSLAQADHLLELPGGLRLGSQFERAKSNLEELLHPLFRYR